MFLRLCALGALLVSMAACTGTPTPGPAPSPTPNPITQVVCNEEQSVASGVASGIGQLCSCQNTAAIQSWLVGKLGSLNFCSQVTTAKDPKNKKGVVGNIVCPPTMQSVFGSVGNALPADWQCSCADPGNQLLQAAIANCEKYVTF